MEVAESQTRGETTSFQFLSRSVFTEGENGTCTV